MLEVPGVDMLHEIPPVHHVEGQPQTVPDRVRHGLVVRRVLRTPTRGLEVEGCEEVFSSLSVGPEVDAGDPEVVATPGEPRAEPQGFVVSRDCLL